jgi:hypothetical protein
MDGCGLDLWLRIGTSGADKISGSIKWVKFFGNSGSINLSRALLGGITKLIKITSFVIKCKVVSCYNISVLSNKTLPHIPVAVEQQIFLIQETEIQINLV